MKPTEFFRRAIPVWETGKSCEMNQMLCFEAKINAPKRTILRIAGQTGYRVFVNGEFVLFGPARAGRGFYRVEELVIPAVGDVTVTVIATGYNCRSFYWLDEESFLCAELLCDGQVLAATGAEGFFAYTCPSHLTRVRRYSYQRTFCEVYDERSALPRERVTLSHVGERKWIAREMEIPAFDYISSVCTVGSGRVTERVPEKTIQCRFLEPSQCVDAFPSDTLDYDSLRIAEHISLVPQEQMPPPLPAVLEADTYLTVSMGGCRTGLVALEVEALDDVDLILTFDELLSNGVADFWRMGAIINVLVYRLKGGRSYHLLSAEPYTFGYINVIARGGSVRLTSLGMHRVGFDTRAIVKHVKEDADEILTRIAHAAEQSFVQNTFDVYMDCPSRERAGWLCDSFFTARVERVLTGKSDVERAFLSNFAMVDHFDELPDGMLPMCYPADVLNREYIPNWAMWLALQLEEYYGRTRDRALIDAFKPKMYALLAYFRPYENAEGLLEKLSGWIFVEWSRCNALVQDINYPTNMLYYRFKCVLADLYGDAALAREAEELRRAIRAQSRGEMFFYDNAVYDANGVARLSGEITETCQYYAFFMGVATVAEDRALWETLVRDFGPARRTDNRYPNVHFSNAFMGNYMRMDLLAAAGEYGLLEENIRGYFDTMAKTTGTLWEHDSTVSSCTHGFASHVLVWLDRLGYLIET